MSASPVLERSDPTDQSDSEPLLRLDGIYKRFGTFEALSGVDLKVRAGEVVAIIGPSGSASSFGSARPPQSRASSRWRPTSWRSRPDRRP